MSICIVITGMGRSGTSLTASLIHKAGVSLGERLVGPGQANPRGFFEDADFYEFHEQLLLERGHTILVPPEFQFEPTRADFEKARRLAVARTDRAIWGWKDPRTSLFLEFWQQIVPNALFLFVYRHPLDVLLSLLRSNTVYAAGLIEGLDAWQAYNAKIKSFYERNAERSILCHSYGLIERIDEFQEVIANKFDLELAFDSDLLDSVYHPSELHRLQLDADTLEAFNMLHPAAAALYEDLNALADLPFSQPAEAQSSRAAPLAQYISSLPPPLDRSQLRGLLMQLIATVAPHLLETFFQEFRIRVSQSEGAKYWFEMQRANWQNEIDQLKKIVNEQQRWIAELEQARSWSKQQIDNYNNAVEQEQQIVQELRMWTAQLEKQLNANPLRQIWSYIRRWDNRLM